MLGVTIQGTQGREQQRHLDVQGWIEQEKGQGRGQRLKLEPEVWLVESGKNQVPPWTKDQH